MSISRYLSIFADFLSSSGVLNPSGGGLGITSTPSNGQIPIGNGTNYTAAAITAGTGISVTNGAGSISISSTTTGTVTSVATGTGLTGGTITTSGTISLVTTSGAIGTYMFAISTSGPVAFGSTVAGSSLRPGGFFGQTNYGSSGAVIPGSLAGFINGSAQSGTWQCMGYCGTPGQTIGCNTGYPWTLWVRTA